MAGRQSEVSPTTHHPSQLSSAIKAHFPLFLSPRPIYGPRFDYPKFIGAERSPDYDERLVQRGSDLYPWTQNRPLGEIPQVRETYSYLEGNYGVLNAHQLGIGESTCAGKLVNRPVFDGGKAWFDVAELSRLAMERCRTARCAVKLMGALAERYGYFGAGWTGPMAEVEAGESLTISDPLEVWIFQILPDGTDAGAVWVAQRVPEDHVVVVANHFTIDHIIPGDEDFMYSRNVWEIAMEHGWWEPPKESEKNSSERSSRPRDENDDDGRDLDLDFDTALGEKETEEEFERFRWIPPFDVSDFSFRRVYTAPAPSSYKPYFNRRTWRVFDTFAPSLNVRSIHVFAHRASNFDFRPSMHFLPFHSLRFPGCSSSHLIPFSSLPSFQFLRTISFRFFPSVSPHMYCSPVSV